MIDTRPENRAEIPKRFKALRARAYLTQKRLGNYIRLWQSSVSDIERGYVVPHPSTFRRFCEFEGRHMQPEIDLPRRWP